MSNQGRNRRPALGVLLLAGQIMQIGTDHIPPVTLLTVVLNALIYLQLIPFLPGVNKACTSYSYVVSKKQYGRLIFSSFYHLDDMHLYYNMVSFIWKGIKLENKLKSRRFLILLAVFSILTQITMLLLNYILYETFNNSQYLYTCAAGFSAVIFGLKVLTTSDSDNNVQYMGIPIVVPPRYACWVELILIQVLVPNASFTGHLAGILVGLVYQFGPLKKIIKGLDKVASGSWLSFSTRPSYTYDSRPSGNRNHGNYSQQHNYNSPPNHQYSDEDEQLQEAIRASLNENNFNSRRGNAPSYAWNIPGNPNEGHFTRVHDRFSSHPSAPPLNEDHRSSNMNATPPYPINDPPYPKADTPYPSHHSSLYPDLDNFSNKKDEETSKYRYSEANEETLRNARLRRFKK